MNHVPAAGSSIRNQKGGRMRGVNSGVNVLEMNLPASTLSIYTDKIFKKRFFWLYKKVSSGLIS